MILCLWSAAAVPTLIVVSGSGQDGPQPLNQLVQHPSVAYTENDEKGSADASANNVANAGEAVEAVPQGTASGGDDNTGDEDNGAMAQREEGAHGGWSLTRGDEAPRHEVYGRDVVGVEGVAHPEHVGQRRGRDERRVVVKHDGCGYPDEGVDGDEDDDGPQAVGRDAMEELGFADGRIQEEVKGRHHNRPVKEGH